MEQEHDNLRAALGWAEQGAQAEIAMALAGALAWFWLVHSHLSEGRGGLQKALRTRGEASASARARALWGAELLARNLGDYDQAVALHEESLALRRELGERAPRPGLAHSLVGHEAARESQ